eukprot:scaffold375638_cov58-Attheya_sp.AAC.1
MAPNSDEADTAMPMDSSPHEVEGVEGEDPTLMTLPKDTNRWINPPKQRQRWGDTQILPHVNWGDLFFDLFYVGAAYNLAAILKASPSGLGILYFLGCIFPVILLWNDKMLYDSRFAAEDDTYHRTLEILILGSVATAVLHIRPVNYMADGENSITMFAFCLGLTLASILHQLRYLELCLWVDGGPEAKQSGLRDVLGRSSSTVWFLAATIASALAYYGSSDSHDDDHRILAGDSDTVFRQTVNSTDLPILLCLIGSFSQLIYTIVMIIFCFPNDGSHKKKTVPMNIDFVIHRTGEWTMLMLGESILSLLIVDIERGINYSLTFYSGIISAILLQYMHFRSQPHHADGHAMRRTKEAGVAFSFLMQAYSASLVAVGGSYKMLLYEFTYEGEYDSGDGKRLLTPSYGPPLGRSLAGGPPSGFSEEDRQQRVANIFCISLAIVWFTSDMMTICHKGLSSNWDRCHCDKDSNFSKIGAFVIFLRICLLVFIATLSQYVSDPTPIAIIGLVGNMAQVILREMSTAIFSDGNVHDTHDGEKHSEESDEDDDKWPNTTQARATHIIGN